MAVPARRSRTRCRPRIKVGYRHIDAALCYGNENEVGQGIKEAIDSGIVKREDLFVTTKLWCSFHARVEEGLQQSLTDLGLDYVDLYLMHWPLAMNPKGELRRDLRTYSIDQTN